MSAFNMDHFPNPTLLSRESGTKQYYRFKKKKQISEQTKDQTPSETKDVIICINLLRIDNFYDFLFVWL